MTNRLPVPVALLRGLLAGWLAGAGLGVAAQQPVSPFYSAFEEDLPAGVTNVGTAVRSATGGADAAGGVLKLTVTNFNQTGSLIIADFAGGAEITNFWARFRVRVGGGTGGEGFSFNVATNLVAPDRPPEPFGELGAGNGLKVQFATRAADGGPAPGLRIFFGGEELGRQDADLRTGQDFVPVEIHFSQVGDPAGDPFAPTNWIHRIHVRYGTNTVEAVRTNSISLPAGSAWGLGARTSDLMDDHWFDNLLILANYHDGPPMLLQAPANAAASFEYRTPLRAAASGTPPLHYQWLTNGVEIRGATEPEYITPPMDFTRNGVKYSVRVTNAQGSINSEPATVALNPVSSLTWPVHPGFNLLAVPFLAADEGNLNALWSTAPHGATFWKFDNASQRWSTTPEVFVDGRGWLPGTTRLTRGEGGALRSPVATTLTATGIVAQTTRPPAINGIMNLRGRPEPGRARYTEIYSGQPAAGLQAYLWDPFNQTFRPPWVYSGRWSPNAWQASHGEGVFVVVAAAPAPRMPTNQPPSLSPIGNQRINESETNVVSFTVSDPDHLAEVLVPTVTNTNPTLLPPDGTLLASADGTNWTLTLIPTARASGRADVTVKVTDPLGAVATRQFRLRVVATDGPPVFFAHPTNTIVGPGETVTLETEAEGRQPISYVWRRNGALLRHETDRFLVITNAQPEDGGTYSAVAMNSLGVDESSKAVVQVAVDSEEVLQDAVAGAKLASGDSGRTSLSNRNATREPGEPMHAGRPGTNSVWFRWEPTTNGLATIDTLGSSFDTLLGVYTGTGITDLVRVTDDDDGAGYFNSRARFNAETGTTYLIAVDGLNGDKGDITLKWELQTGADRLPMILRHPEGLALPPRSTAKFSVEVDAPAPQELRYQWFHNGTNALAPGTRSSLVLSQLNAGHLGTYRVEVIRGAVTNASRDAVLELATAASTSTFDKLGDAVAPAGPPPSARSLHRAPRRPASVAVSVGTPGSRMFLNNSGDTQVDEHYADVVFGRSRWIPVELPDHGALVVDTFGSEVDTVTRLTRWDGSFGSDPEVLADNNDDPGKRGAWSLLVATNLPAGTNYFVLVDRVITPTNFNAVDGPIHVNWTFVPQDAEFRSTLPTLFTEADLRNVESLVTNLMDGQLPLHDYLRGQFGAKTNSLSDWLARDPALRTAAEVTGVLVAGLNDLVTGGLLWTSDRFAGVELDDELLARIKRDTKPGKWPRLNHLLLEEVFAGALHPPSERLFQKWLSLHASGRTHFRVVDDPGKSRLQFESAGDLFDAAGGLGWRKLVGSLDLADDSWLNIIQLPDGGAPGTNRFYRVVRQAR